MIQRRKTIRAVLRRSSAAPTLEQFAAAGDQDNPVILTISPGWLEVTVLSP
jgi:hypothetical protein